MHVLETTGFSTSQRKTTMGGRHSTEVAPALLTQPTRIRFPAFPKFFSEKNFSDL